MIFATFARFSCSTLQEFYMFAPAIGQGEPWKSALAGHEINQIEIENEKKRLMLERFQEEVSHITLAPPWLLQP